MMKAILACVLFLFGSAHAETWGVHLYTEHDLPRNNFNPGVYYIGNSGWTVGGYYNSSKNLSLNAGYHWQTRNFYGVSLGLDVGAVTGYWKPVLPYLTPSLALQCSPVWAARLTYLPGWHETRQRTNALGLQESYMWHSATGLHLSVERRF